MSSVTIHICFMRIRIQPKISIQIRIRIRVPNKIRSESRPLCDKVLVTLIMNISTLYNLSTRGGLHAIIFEKHIVNLYKN